MPFEITWKNTVERGRPQMIIREMSIARWIPKDTNTHRLCYTYCFSLHRWLYEHSSMLRYMYIVKIVVRYELHTERRGYIALTQNKIKFTQQHLL